MSKFLKSLKIVGVFLAFTCLLSLVWFRLECRASPEVDCSYLDFIVYLLGYGELDHVNPYLRPIFTILGLFSVTLLSSVFTVNLFEWKNKLFLGNRLIVYASDPEVLTAGLFLYAPHRDIYNVDITLIAGIQPETCSEELQIPFVQKNTARFLSFSIQPGSVLYRYFRYAALNPQSDAVLVATISYTDISSGLDYTICQKFRLFDPHGGIVFIEQSPVEPPVTRHSFTELTRQSSLLARDTVLAYAKRSRFPLVLDSACLIHAEEISAQHGPDCVHCDIHFNPKADYPADFFTMLCLPKPLDGNWAVYRKLNCGLVLNMQVSENIKVIMELKQADGSLLISPAPEFVPESNGRYVYPLQNIPEQQLEQVKELCFTVFYKNVSSPQLQSGFTLSACALEVL